MACAPPRVGSDAARQLSIAQGYHLSKHCKMKQSLFRSSLWHKSCKGQLHVWHVRNMATQAVAVEEMEAGEFSEKKTMRWQRWQTHETMVLIAAKKQHDLGQAERTEAARKKARDKWKEIEAFCQEKGIERSAEQCQTRWSRLMSAYTQIRSWEENITPEQLSFWSMKLDERKDKGFVMFLDQKTYNALDELYNKKADDIKNSLVEDDVEELSGLGSIDHTVDVRDGQKYDADRADLKCGSAHGEAHKGDDKDNQLPIGFTNDEKVQADFLSAGSNKDWCKGSLEKHGIEEHINVMPRDDNNSQFSPTMHDGAMPAAREGMEVQPEGVDGSSLAYHETNFSHTDSLKAGGIVHANDFSTSIEKLECQETISTWDDNNSQFSPTAHDGTMPAAREAVEEQSEGVDGSSLAYHGTNFSHTDNLKAEGIVHRNDFLASVEKLECQETVSPRDDNNSQFSPTMHDGTMPAAREGMEEQSEGVDGSSLSYHETNFSHTDNLKAGGVVHGNEFLAPVERLECQETASPLSFVGVDVIDENLSGQVAGTADTYISMDEQGCENLSEERNLTKEACIDKNEKGEGFFKVCKDNSPPCHKSAEDISNAWVNKTQSNCMEAEGNNDVSQKVEDMVAHTNNFVPIVGEVYNRDLHSSPKQQQFGANFVTDSKEETGTDGVSEHGCEDGNTFLSICSSEISESTSSLGKTSGNVQDEHPQKNQSQPSREDHVEMNAGIVEGIASVFEHTTGHSFNEKRDGELQNGSADYNGKTTKHGQNIEFSEVALEDGDSLVKTESQLVIGKEGNDATDTMKVAIKEGVRLTEMTESRGSTVDAGTSALSSLQHQFHHASSTLEHEGLIQGDNGSSGKDCEVKRAESSETAAAEQEFAIKDRRGRTVTSVKGTVKDQSQKSNNSSKFDEDVFMYIPAAIGSLMRSVLQTIRNFLKF